MNGFGKALMGVIRISIDRTIARKILSGVTVLALAVVVLLVAAGGASADEIVWEYSTGLNHPEDAERLPNDNTLIADTDNHRIIEVEPDGTIVWEYNTGLDHPCDAERLSGGNTLIIDTGHFRVVEVENLIGCVGCVTGHVYQCGETVTESCVFNGSMRCTNNTRHGLVIGADGITINGNGHRLIGNENATVCQYGSENNPSSVPHHGIFNSFYISGVHYKYEDVVVKNLEIENFCCGIVLHYIKNNTIENCTVHHNGNATLGVTHGIQLANARNCTIRNNWVHNNTAGPSCGCGGGGNGINIYGGEGPQSKDYLVIDNNKLCDNKKAGFFTKFMMDHSTISNNTATGNGHSGICLRCMLSDHNIIEHNYASNNHGTGIFLGGINNIVRNNIVLNNMNGSEYRAGGAYGCYSGTPAEYVARYGVGLTNRGDSGKAILSENTFCGNDAYDIEVRFPDNGGVNITGDDNTCNTTSNYNDTGTTGCTYYCPGESDLNISGKYEQWYGDIYNVIYMVTNLGHSTAGESVTGIHIDGILEKTDPIGLIGPGKSYNKTVGPFTMSDDNDTILVCADNDNAVDENNEDNNCLENVFIGVVMPDLVITEKSEEWVDFENKTYNITYIVKNIGNANANQSTTSIIIDGSEVATDPVELLAPQATHTAELGPFMMLDESDTIRICADKDNIVEETNEDNNCLENIFRLSGKPDLIITEKFEEWVANNETYRNYTITYTIKNTGTGDANESTTSIIIDGTEVAIDPVEALTEGESYTSTFGPFTITDENDTIKICADNESVVDESNEDNNCIENTFNYSQIGCVAEDGTLFRCGNTVTKSCTLNGDTICASGACLIIGTDGIMIDGNDYRMTGSVILADCDGMGSESSPCTASGIYNEGFDNIKIKNLEIENFCTGIALADVCNITVNNCSIHDNGFYTGNMVTHGIHACNIAEGTPDDPALTITESEIYNNEGTGSACGAGGNGIFIYAGSGDKHEYCNISHNKLHHNAKSGFWTKMMLTRSEITHNEAWGNGYGTGITDDQRGGIVLRCAMSNENLIAYNDVYDNYVDGIFIGGSNNTIEYNNVTNNTDDGIDMGRGDGSYNNELYENSVCENWDSDITTFGAESNTIGENNTCDSTNNYDDTGATGCTYICGGNIVEFCADPTKGAAPLTVSFTDEARPQENKESWSWDFDGDGIEDNTTQNPVNAYTTDVSYSYYNVSLIVNWSGAGAGSASETKTEYIRVWRPDAAPNADFNTPPGVGDHTIPVTFTDTSLGEITSRRWDFGDGNTSDEQNPVHIYMANGIYNVSLKVTGPGGLSKDTKFYCIRVGTEGAPKRPLTDAHFFADKKTGSAPFIVQFTDMSRSEGEIVSWKWDFGDGNTSNEQNTQHTYDSLGIYNVSLETMLITGAVTNETKIDYITVSTAAPAPFVISGRVNCTNGDPVNDPGVTVTNLNSSQILPVETYAASNYYRIVVTSGNVSTGNVLHFNVTGSSNPIDFNHTITADEIEAGGFARNITVDCGFTGICGDVTCNGVVDTGDVILLSNYVGYYPGMPQYALNSTQQWAGDVTGNNVIDTGDVILLSNYVGYSGYELNCTCI